MRSKIVGHFIKECNLVILPSLFPIEIHYGVH